MSETLTSMLEAYPLLSPLIAFLMGVLTSISPCSLSSLPLVIAYVSQTTTETKKGFLYSLLFALGTAITFSLLGLIAISLGKVMRGAGSWWYILLGILMVLLALQSWNVISGVPSANLLQKNQRRGYLGALIAGFLMGLFSSPCATPMLISLLAFITLSESTFYSMLLIFFFSLGHGVLSVIAGTSSTFIRRIRNTRISRYASYIIGTLILILGLYMFYLGF